MSPIHAVKFYPQAFAGFVSMESSLPANSMIQPYLFLLLCCFADDLLALRAGNLPKIKKETMLKTSALSL